MHQDSLIVDFWYHLTYAGYDYKTTFVTTPSGKSEAIYLTSFDLVRIVWESIKVYLHTVETTQKTMTFRFNRQIRPSVSYSTDTSNTAGLCGCGVGVSAIRWKEHKISDEKYV